MNFRCIVTLKIAVVAIATVAFVAGSSSAEQWVTYEPKDGAGDGKHVVFVAGEWEYRSEEGFPMLAKILSQRHGFKCTVLFPINRDTGEIDPNVTDNIPGLEILRSADMMVVLAMDLELPDEQMKEFVDFAESGKPVFGFRCSVLAFKYRKNKESPFSHFGLETEEGGFGGRVLGERWRGHHGHHAVESTRGLIDGPNRNHPILKGVKGDIWGPTDVYQIDQLPDDAAVLAWGMVLKGMKPDDTPNINKPIMPMVWTRNYKSASGNVARVITSTIGASEDLASEDLRRVFVNSVYWGLGMDGKISEKSNVDYVTPFIPRPFGRNKFQKGKRPADYSLASE